MSDGSCRDIISFLIRTPSDIFDKRYDFVTINSYD